MLYLEQLVQDIAYIYFNCVIEGVHVSLYELSRGWGGGDFRIS